MCSLSPDVVLPWPWLTDYRVNNPNKSPKALLLAPESSVLLKYWHSEKWKLLSKRMRQDGWCVTLIIQRGDAVSSISPDDFDGIWQGSLTELGRLVGNSQAVIAVDSFIGHLAAAMDIPVLSLFSTQLPELWRPWGKRTAIVVADGYPCRPCDQKRCVRPYDNCMDVIQVDQVVKAFQRLIDDNK